MNYLNDPGLKTTQPDILRHALLGASTAIAVLEGGDFTLTYANEALFRVWGKDSDIVGKNLIEILPELRDQPFPQILKKVLITGEKHEEKDALSYVIKNGVREVIYFDYSYTAIKDDELNNVGVLVVANDVTQKVVAQQRIREQDRNFRDTILQVPVAITLLRSADFIIEMANQHSLRMWKKNHDVVGRKLADVFPEYQEQGFINILTGVFESGEVYRGTEVPFEIRENGLSRIIYSNFIYQPIYEKGIVTSIISIGTDVTEQVEARKKLETLAEELRVLNTKKDEFIGIASHELRTPLTSLSGYLQILERHQTDEAQKAYVKKTIIHADKLTSLVNDILDVSKIEAGKLQLSAAEFELVSLVKDVIENVQLSSRTHMIRLNTTEDTLSMYGDSHRLEQVVINLLTNAIKYSPKANEVTILLRVEEEEVHLGVRDQGIGIPADKMDNLFSRFYRVDNLSPHMSGLGIGLYITKEIVERHGGRIRVESEEGKGSTFWVILPKPDQSTVVDQST